MFVLGLVEDERESGSEDEQAVLRRLLFYMVCYSLT